MIKKERGKKAEKEKVSVKKKITQKRPAKKKTGCPESTLDTIVSKIVREVYPFLCHGACDKNKVLTPYSEGVQGSYNCCHFVGRAKKSTRFLLNNVLPGCVRCNRFVPEHVFFLGKWLDKYYGEGNSERMVLLGKRGAKISPKIRKEMYEYYKVVYNDILHEKSQAEVLGIDNKTLYENLLNIARKTAKEFEERFITPNLM